MGGIQRTSAPNADCTRSAGAGDRNIAASVGHGAPTARPTEREEVAALAPPQPGGSVGPPRGALLRARSHAPEGRLAFHHSAGSEPRSVGARIAHTGRVVVAASRLWDLVRDASPVLTSPTIADTTFPARSVIPSVTREQVRRVITNTFYNKLCGHKAMVSILIASFRFLFANVHLLPAPFPTTVGSVRRSSVGSVVDNMLKTPEAFAFGTLQHGF